MLWTKETDPQVPRMRERLDAFYRSTTEYHAFHDVSDQATYWASVGESIDRRLAARGDTDGPVKVLEFGAGRTGFARYLSDAQRRGVHFTAQDVTDANREFLGGEADAVHIGDLSELSGPFDIVFSTFVWEHVSNPAATLETVLSLLNPGGELFLFCPRYDLPMYRPPALRHLPKWRQYLATLQLSLDRLRVRLGGRPGFWVTPEPAVLNVEHWFRDADAVHLVSLHDLRAALRGRADVEVVDAAGGLRWRLLQLQVRIAPHA